MRTAPESARRPELRPKALLVALLAAMLLAAGAACSGGGVEEEMLARFFRSIEQEDRTTMSGVSMVNFPGGAASSWEIIEIGAETSGPYRIPELREEVTTGERRRDEQFQVLYAFRQGNAEAIDAIAARRERDPEARIGGRLGEIDEAWEAHQAERRRLVTALSEAQMALEGERRRTQRSLLREAAVDYLTGSVREKEVMVRVHEVETGPRDYRFTLFRYDLVNQFDNEVPSRWLIVGIEPAGPGE